MTRKLKLGWGRKPIPFCKDDVYDQALHKGFEIYWVESQSPYYARKTYLVRPDGKTYYANDTVYLNTIIHYMRDNDCMMWGEVGCMVGVITWKRA